MTEIIEQVRSLIRKRKFDEARELAQHLINDDERNIHAWWNLALALQSLGRLEDSIEAFRKLLKLAPRLGYVWAHYGVVLAANKQYDQGLKALSHALQIDPKEDFAARQAARICKEQDDLDGQIHYLTRLDAMGEANGVDLNALGIIYWQKNHFGKAIQYYHRSAAILGTCAPYLNLALVYNHEEVSQDVDAIDCLERALIIDPDNDRAKSRLSKIKPRLEKLANDVLESGSAGLAKKDWYQFYINPFELLRADRRKNIHDYNSKEIQRLKKRLLHEIDLEDGHLEHYVEGLTIDKSMAIGICEELNNEALKKYHWLVFTEPYFLGFLMRGEIRHFLCLEDYKPINLLEELDKEWSGFREWLSNPFCRQYDLVLTQALQKMQLPLVESLFDGRRWILREHEEQCFEGARRQVKIILNPLRQAVERAVATKPSRSLMNEVLNQNGLISIINLLPEPFRDLQSEAVSMVRDIAITAVNEHGDTDFSREILTQSLNFNFKSVSLTQKLTEDFKQLDKLIEQERQHEAKLSIGKHKFEVTKQGVQQGSIFIRSDDVSTIRFGVKIMANQNLPDYQFLMVYRNDFGKEVMFSWQSYENINKHKEDFGALINAALNYVVPKIYEKVRKQLDSGQEIRIGPCFLTKDALVIEKSGWFMTKKHMVPWNRVESKMSNGLLSVFDRNNPKTRAEMEIRDTENAIILQFFADTHE